MVLKKKNQDVQVSYLQLPEGDVGLTWSQVPDVPVSYREIGNG